MNPGWRDERDLGENRPELSMAREPKQINIRLTAKPATAPRATIEVVEAGGALLLSVSGLIDEHFTGFGSVSPSVKTAIINTTGLTRMTSFGVRRWMVATDALSNRIPDVYLVGCPIFFVDQLNMVLNFGGAARVLTVVAPYGCPACGRESSELVDVVAGRTTLAKGGVPDKACLCGVKLEFDETPESYFSFASKYAASKIHPEAAELLAAHGLYTSATSAAAKPAKILKLVQGSVTYFRISGTIGSQFRARPFLVGAEGEVVIDLAEVDRFEPAGHREWNKLLTTLAANVLATTLVDVGPAVLEAAAAGGFTIDDRFAVWSVVVPYHCTVCDRTTHESVPCSSMTAGFEERLCAGCGAPSRALAEAAVVAPLGDARGDVPSESTKLIQRREEMLARAQADGLSEAAESLTPVIDSDSIFGKYKITRRLSAGGMADVFLAKQVGIGGFEKPVALKRIQRDLLERRHLAVEMFLNEARIAARLMHPNIVQVFDVGESHGALYLAMEYVHGRDFNELLKRLRGRRIGLPLAAACYVVREIAIALDHAYWSKDIDGKQLGVVHRDVSPHNVMLGFDGSVKLLDFGVAMSGLTGADTMVVGKWMYMSPEHTRNKNVDHRSDLFSLGVILYESCAGRAPFASAHAKETVRKIREGDYIPVQRHAPEIPDRLAALVDGLLAPDPDRRPQHGQQLAEALSDIAREGALEVTGRHIARLMAEVFPEGVGQGGTGQVSTTAPWVTVDSELAWRETAPIVKVDLNFDELSGMPPEDPMTVTAPGPPPSRSTGMLVTVLEVLGIVVVVLALLYFVFWS